MSSRELLGLFVTIAIISFVTLPGEGGPVTLSSNLKQPSICPNETSVTFACMTRNLRVHWRVDNRDIVLEKVRVGLGGLSRVNGYITTLLRCTEEEGCISVLNILTSDQIKKVVQCYNGSESTIQTVQYNHEVSAPPSPPENLTLEALDENTRRLSWSSRNSEDELSHYFIQLDNAEPLLVQNSSMAISSGVAHTVRLHAVNKCGQSSNVTAKIIQSDVTPSPATPSTTVTTPIISSDAATESVVPRTESVNGSAFKAVVIVLCLFVLATILLSIALAYCSFKHFREQKNSQKEPTQNPPPPPPQQQITSSHPDTGDKWDPDMSFRSAA